MKITKYQHACLVIEKDKTIIVIDPGTLSHDFIAPNSVDAVVITHEHTDHYDEKLVGKLLSKNPKAKFIAHESISSKYTSHEVVAPSIGEAYMVGNLQLRFFGGTHASITSSIQTPPNLGVLVDERLYYPGDSFAIPEGYKVHELALPIAAPWSKVQDIATFLAYIKPTFILPTHDAILSEDGKVIFDNLVTKIASEYGAQYKRLDSSSITLPAIAVDQPQNLQQQLQP